MTKRRIVLASADATAQSELARKLRDAGHEVVLLGGQQTSEQLARTAIAEDAEELVVDEHADELTSLLGKLGADGVRVTAARDLVV